MAKLRRNHSRRGGAAAGATLLKVTVFALILFALIWAFYRWRPAGDGARVPGPSPYDGANWYLPEHDPATLVPHAGFTVSYHEAWEQAAWVAYILRGSDLDLPWTERRNTFRPDPDVPTGSSVPDDYRGSGYDRGHLAPFADFAWNPERADETFFMSNVSPQNRAFNQGIWRELEELVRAWARRDGRLYVVSGPVTSLPPLRTIGRRNRVAVPAAYFKVILDLEGDEQKGIGFLLPNTESDRPLLDYAVPIDSVEATLGYDMFPDLMPPDLERRLEATVEPQRWPMDEAKYRRRVNQWNNVK